MRKYLLIIALTLFPHFVIACASMEAQSSPEGVIKYFFKSLRENQMNNVKTVVSPRLTKIYSGPNGSGYTSIEEWAVGFRLIDDYELKASEVIEPIGKAERTLKYSVQYDVSGHIGNDFIVVSLIHGLWYWDQDLNEQYF
jgi:hypothetical protein